MDIKDNRLFQLENEKRQLASDLAREKSQRQQEDFQSKHKISELEAENTTLKRKLREHNIF